MLDRIEARRPMVLGCGVAAVGFYLWVLSPANTDALNRVSRDRYGEATGITQTVRNFGSSLGLAVLGSILILENRSNLESTADKHGFSKQVGGEIADQISQGTGAGEAPAHLPAQVQKSSTPSPTTSRWPPGRSSTGWRR
jgi:hypothetical protein